MAVMAYTATVLRILIASPSDTGEARDAVEKAVHEWNQANAQNKQVVLQPWRWETSSVPQLGGHPQSFINMQGVEGSDIVIALFGGRLGSPTPEAVSGTVEEIERAEALGKPVHPYFSTAPLPHDVDTKQLEGLREFKAELQKRGLLGEFNTTTQLEHEVRKAIEYDIAQMKLTPLASTSTTAGVRFIVQPHQEREHNGFSRSGRPQYRTRRWLEITNVGELDAEEVTFEPAIEDSRMYLATDGTPTVIHAGQSRRLGVEFAMGGGSPDVLRVRWLEGGEAREKDFHVG